jgi:hypothetical protein
MINYISENEFSQVEKNLRNKIDYRHWTINIKQYLNLRKIERN